ncbi:MAG: Abi family protein, partial [Muribaculaceae bacterium]|nr:Abi family protein [Muribaculaceae bacterium]
PNRMRRDLSACNSNTCKAMTLYRYNIKLSQELLAVVGCFEVALRNRINKHFVTQDGNDWLRDLILPNGKFYSDHRVSKTKRIIKKAYDGLLRSNTYSHDKLLSEMEFGIWKYMFSNVQYNLTGQNLLSIFPNKPRSTRLQQYNNSYIFQELDYINNLRNRIAHHEPICFGTGSNRTRVDLSYALNRYVRILTLLKWLDIDEKSLLYGLGNVTNICNKIQAL